MSPGDIALSHDDYGKAIELYRTEGKAAGPEGERAHAAMIRTLLRANSLKDAEDEAKTWVAAAPDDPWSGIALAEVQMRQGDVTNSAKTLQAAEKRDPCNPQVHVDIARFYRLNAMNAAAKQHLDTAHTLDPIDDDIESRWIPMQPRAVQLAELTRYLDRATFLSPQERMSLEKQKARLSQPPAPACQLVTPINSVAIPFRGIQNGPRAQMIWGLNISFNDKPRRLEIDTGANGLILSRIAANALHLTPEETFKMGGIGDEGGADTYLAKVDSIKIGTLEFQHCAVRVVNTKNAEGEDKLDGVDGLIGGDVFSKFILTLDFPGHMMKLDPLPPIPGATQAVVTLDTGTGEQVEDVQPQNRYVDPSMQTWTKVYSVGWDLILPVHLNDGPLRLFVIDTGSGTNLISPAAAREVTHVEGDNATTITGISGDVKKVYATGSLNLSFAGLRQPVMNMTSIDTSAISRNDGLEISGFLGAPTLHQLTLRIDYRDRLVNFSYDPKRVVKCVETETGNLGECF